jgi:ADP-sugar diphosphatase
MNFCQATGMSELLNQSLEFKSWKKKLVSNGVELENVSVIGEISRDKKTLFAALIDCVINTPEGDKVPRLLVLQSDGIMIIPLFRCDEDNTFYTLMVEQRRIADGGNNMEFPAGAVNVPGEDPYEMAVQEIKEELGLTIERKELIILNQKPIISCAAFSSSSTDYFYFERNVSKSFLLEMDGRVTGCHLDQEYIKVRLQKMSDVAKNNSNALCLAAIKLLEQNRGEIFC